MPKRNPPRNPPTCPPAAGSGRFAYEGLERVIHEKARLGIMTSLVAHPDGLLFVDLKEFCALTDGNLNRHLQVLREAGFVEVWKGYKRNRSQTMCRVTPRGRERFLEYLGTLEKVVADAAAAARAGVADPSAKRLLNGLWPA
ncbi:MAG: transcriptional regulator [Planctomycetota bacterium]|jgi:DNA-binding MarR family transcriptional regulator